MESTSSPDNGRQSRGLGRFWPVQGGPTPGQRLPSPQSASGSAADSADSAPESPESSALDAPTGEHPQVGDGQPAVPGVHQLGLSSEMQMVPLGSRRAPEVVGGGGPRLVGKFPPDLEPGPRHGAVVPLPTGRSPLDGVPLPGSRSPFGPIASASNGTGPDPESPKRSALGSGAPFGSALGSPFTPSRGPASGESAGPSSPASASPSADSPAPGSGAAAPGSGAPASGSSAPGPGSSASGPGSSASGPGSSAPGAGSSAPAPGSPPPATSRGAAAVPVAGQRSGDDQPRTTEGQGDESGDGPRTTVGARTAAGWAALPTSGMPATGSPGSPIAAGPSGRIAEAVRPESAPPRPGEPPRPTDPASPRPGDPASSRPGDASGPRPGDGSVPRAGERPDVAPLPSPRRSTTLDDAEEPRPRGGRRAAPEPDEESSEAAAATEAKADGPKRPGDIDETAIAFWEDKAIERFRGEWHEVKADFVDDPVAALTRAHELITEAVNELTGSLLAERDELDPLRTTSTPDTESMRMAMRGYREFLDRILAL